LGQGEKIGWRYLQDYESREFHEGLHPPDQIRRAGVSAMLNIAEGLVRRTDKEFAQFLFVAHGSLAEIQSSLYIALDQE
jgi:four helix bundle protein